jgi:predicted thioesterase
MEIRGIVHGNRIELETQVPALEGKRVRVRLDVLDNDKLLSPAEQSEVWRQWVEAGPQGPLEDDADGWP